MARCFELRTYHATPDKIERLHARFRDYVFALFAKHGLEVIGYWVPINDEGVKDTIIYMVSGGSTPEEHKATYDAFRADPEWHRVRRMTEENPGPNNRLPDSVQSILLTPTDFSPMQ